MSSFRTYAIITKTNKELEALKVIHDSQDIQGGYDSFWEAYRIIEKAIKALEIIKSYADFKVYEMQDSYFLSTGNNYRSQKKITKEEYDLLKEILK